MPQAHRNRCAPIACVQRVNLSCKPLREEKTAHLAFPSSNPSHVYLHCLVSVSRCFALIVSADVFWVLFCCGLNGGFRLPLLLFPRPSREVALQGRSHPESDASTQAAASCEATATFYRLEKTAVEVSGTQRRWRMYSCSLFCGLRVKGVHTCGGGRDLSVCVWTLPRLHDQVHTK